jgi:CBS domain-containing protein
VRTLNDLELDAPIGQGRPTGPTIPRDTSLHFALSMMLAEGTTRLDVVDGENHPVGSVRLDSITKLIAPEDPAAATGADQLDNPGGS